MTMWNNFRQCLPDSVLRRRKDRDYILQGPGYKTMHTLHKEDVRQRLESLCGVSVAHNKNHQRLGWSVPWHTAGAAGCLKLSFRNSWLSFSRAGFQAGYLFGGRTFNELMEESSNDPMDVIYNNFLSLYFDEDLNPLDFLQDKGESLSISLNLPFPVENNLMFEPRNYISLYLKGFLQGAVDKADNFGLSGRK